MLDNVIDWFLAFVVTLVQHFVSLYTFGGLCVVFWGLCLIFYVFV